MAPGETEHLQAPSDDSAPVDSAPVAAPSPTLPPPEKPSEVRQRSYVVLSFWLVVLLLGLPIWWKTTAIYRADLPLDSMLKWADGKVRYQKPSDALFPPADCIWLIGMSTRLSPPDLDTSRFPARAGGAESYTIDPACVGRSERLLRPPSAPGACAAERAPSKRRFPNRFDDSP
jgi:hypothetical protein